ncbi:hypothetical protein KIN20_013180 [Parelaphostrongylus tenuis]|uniref:Uncharacterized protein n=1 Tax=Parelaphostrongylus tenuis TaxID=148309 RepID=A0AAD5MUC9_PARTN|nr:hypothetical protein KIN20_013180 [Parelaphostrongylus tenuis]
MDLQVIMTVADYNWKEATHSRHKRDMIVVKMKNILESMVEPVHMDQELLLSRSVGKSNNKELGDEADNIMESNAIVIDTDSWAMTQKIK